MLFYSKHLILKAKKLLKILFYQVIIVNTWKEIYLLCILYNY